MTQEFFGHLGPGLPPERELVECVRADARTFARIVMLGLRSFYADSVIADAGIGCYTWDGVDGGNTRIDFFDNMPPQKDGKNPGIYVRHGEISFEKLTNRNIVASSYDNSETILTTATSVSLLVDHIFEKETEAYRIADLTFQALLGPICLWLERAGAISIQPRGIAGPRKKSSEPETHYGVAFRFDVFYYPLVSRKLESHRLREIVEYISTTGTP